jgi:hypothetical protein
MKTVTDSNISSAASQSRRKAFEKANELKSITGANIVIEGVIFDRISPRLNPQHKETMEYLYKIDNTGKNVLGYSIVSTIKFMAKREAKWDCVLILTENPQRYCDGEENKRIVCITPVDFLSKMTRFKQLYDSYQDFLKLNPHAKELRSQIIENLILDTFFGIKLP